MSFTPSPQQQAALDAVAKWRADADARQIFRLFGYAGTGKTSIAKLAAAQEDRPVYTAFTAKAASVMRSKGCVGARNIHQLLYTSENSSGSVLQDELVAGTLSLLQPAWKHSKEGLSFQVNARDELRHATMLIIDEGSMIGNDILADLLPLEIPILVLADPAQLPPIGDDRGALTAGEPDAFLTEIHRQALDNPTIQLSMKARQGEWIPSGSYGDSRVG